MPPLLLTDEEAVAIAIGLRVAASQRLIGGPETTLTALAKLEQVLPAPLRRRVNALADAVQPAGIRAGRRGLERGARRTRAGLPRPRARALHLHRRIRRGDAAARRAARARARRPALVPAVLGPRRARTGAPSASTGSPTSSTPACCSSRSPLTPEQIEEFILVARVVGARSRSRPTSSWTCRSTDMRECVRPVGPGRRAPRMPTRTRWPVGGARLPRDDVRHGVDARRGRVHDGSGRAGARRAARDAANGCCARSMRLRRRPAVADGPRVGVTRDTQRNRRSRVLVVLSGRRGPRASGASRRSGRSRAPVHTRKRCGFDSRRRVHFRYRSPMHEARWASVAHSPDAGAIHAIA